MFNYSDDKPSTSEKGSKSEQLAEEYLVAEGFKIVSKNYHFGKIGEIDIIAREKNVLVFVEVKSRIGDNPIAPLDQITPAKAQKLKKTAEGYIYTHGLYDQECRFDVIAIEYKRGKPEIEHLRNAIVYF